MKRGLNQVLFQFMPQKTFDNPEHGTIERVVRVKGKNVTDEVNHEYLVNRVYAEVENWGGSNTGFLPPEPANYTVREPRKVITEVFPLVFRCRTCGKIHNFSRRKGALEDNVPECDNCGGSNLNQIHHVMICEVCSEIKSVWVPRCNQHGFRAIKLDDSAERYKNFRWYCDICGNTVQTGVWRQCDCDENMIPTVHRASQAYRIHNLKDVHLHHEYELEDGTRETESLTSVALGAAFGIYDHPETTIQELMESDTGEKAGVADILNDPDIDEATREVLREKYGAEAEAETELDEVREQTDQLVADDRRLSRNHLNYLRAREEIEIDSVHNLIDSSDPTTPDVEQLLDSFGIEEVQLTSEFPILTAVYGYHRTFDDPDNNQFPQIRSFPYLKDGCPIYASNTETESVILTLDHERVAQWLFENGVLEEEPANMDEPEIRALLYNRMQEIEPYTDLEELSDTSEYVLGLLHTLSHVLIKEAAMLSGIEDTSLAEFLFPEALSVAIYSNKTESFTIGGLYSLVERNLEQWFETARTESQYCIYDPVCAEQGGSCHACTHVSEIGCQHFNQRMSRGYLHGEADATNDIRGYWDL